MAEKLGIKRSTYQYWEEKTPGIDKVRMVEKALNLPSGSLTDENFGAFGQKVAEPAAGYNSREKELERALVEELRDKVKILQQHNEFLSRNFEVSLNSIHQISVAQLVHLKTLEWYQADRASGGDPEKTDRELMRMGSKIAELAGVASKEGNPVGR